ncbi:alpha-2-macroglobulin family protein [Pseudaminobacter sp. 19-2017]|uniref:Alpha-2-macroglobulin family protein n=1 Tax=Pseudaminobacter soli (ex Zhang et al. 2022) TaxID=2831468 RepID=A0A942E0V6_9HYPH|nr:alpha-2-macroglobulin family protein [Pseudaminobacter soli]MBS3649118.1 alpha-2-macroglobulin family protein [Pseudaminobacter soli]
MRAVRFLSAFLLLVLAGAAPGLAAEARQIATTPDSDYFGFDLRAEQNVSLDQCKAICLGDAQCRAFTYNTKAKWCFLKSDFATVKTFNGAVAGKVVTIDGEPDIGAPPEIPFFPTWMADEARQYRTKLLATSPSEQQGLVTLTESAKQDLRTGDANAAIAKYGSAIRIAPQDARLWLAMAHANLAAHGNGQEMTGYSRDATSAAWNAYQLSRMRPVRAEVLAVIASGLDRRELSRPALQAYEASTDLVNSAEVRSQYEDLKARKGFRIVEHSIDADTHSPRVCAQFSEELVKIGVDYAPFVTVDGAAPKAVEAKDRQICVEGLEHGKNYNITFRAGIPAAIGETITSPVALSVYIQDRGPTARFTGDSFVLPAHARRGIPLVTVNMAVADMKLYRIGDRSLAQLLSGYQFLRQLDGYDITNIADQIGAPVWEGKLEIANELNKEITTSFPVDEALPDRAPGVYVLTAQRENDTSDTWTSRATQWFVVSDIGLSAYTGQDGLNVFARSLGSAKPLAGVELTLLARNNEILGKATSDANGRATFSPGLTRGSGGMVPAVLTASSGGNDFVFLDMVRAGFDLSDRGVAGREAPGALDVYTWTERGIYRVGETVHVAALARDHTAKAVENLPLTFVFSRPDGVEDRRMTSDGRAAGGHAVDLPLTADAMRGTWTVSIYTDPKQPAVSSQMFLVEDFVPDRIEFTLGSDKDEIAAGEPANITVDGRFLYGAPAAGLALEGEIVVQSTRDLVNFPNFQFGLADEQEGDATRIPLVALPPVGEDGKATFPVKVDTLPSTTRLLTAKVTVRMLESGGRAIENSSDLGVKSTADAIGIRPDFSGGQVREGDTAGFTVIMLDPNGSRKALSAAQWSLVKVERDYQWYRSGNFWNYEPVTHTRAISNGTLDIAADGSTTLSMPVDWGRYRLEVTTADPEGPATSVEFDAGWYVMATSTETPDGLEIALDKDKYAPGEVAKLKISPRFAGELLVTVGAERLLSTQTATVPEGGATIDIPVSADWGAGAYVTATLFRPGDAQESRMPARAIGLKWLTIDPGAKKLDVALAPVAKTQPRQPLTIPVSVTGIASATDAYVTVAAVDLGILNLTDYRPPNPESWYFGQRRLGLELRDLYGRLIDGSLGAAGRLRTGGDGAAMTSHGSPPTEKLVAFFAGPVKLDSEGKAAISFDIPQFNGTVRIMAVAWTKDAVGHASTDVIVRDPVVITAGLPRFMAPGDAALMRLDIANTDGPDGDYEFLVETTGDLSTGNAALPEKVTLTSGRRQTVTVPLVAQTAGDATVTVRLAHTGGTAVDQTLHVPVRPATLPVTNRLVVDLGPNGSLRVDRELLAESVLPGAHVSVGVSPSAALDVPSLLLALDLYPYGCAEQTTSRALPLLYVSELAAGAGMSDDPALRERIQKAIYAVLNYQSSSGSFGLWGPGSGDLWLDAYVTDFLTRARELNYDVPQQAMDQALSNLQNSLAYDVNLQDRGTEIAYSLYVLARNKKASVGDLRYYADTQIEAFSSPLAIAQLAASLALYGDTQRSEATFLAALQLAQSQSEHDYSRSDYGSRLRDGAAMLALAAESKPMSSVVPRLVSFVSAERQATRWNSTQENAWMLLAARALSANAADMRLAVNGVEHTGVFSERFEGSEIVESPIIVTNTGQDTAQAVVTAVAAPVRPLPAGGDGFTIERTHYRLDGTEANVTEVRQNERFVVVLKLTEENDWPSRVLVSDLLPAGFEIDNPGLVSSANLANFPWLAQTEAAHLEFRDDRFVAAFDRSADSPHEFTLAYVVRAVTPGVYAHPAASVEDMYRPQFSARTATGMMEVKE